MHNTLYLSFYGNQIVIHANTLLQSALVSILFTLAFTPAIVLLAYYSTELDDDCADLCIECSGGNGECDETAYDYLMNISVTLITCVVRYS